jgi:hypothetical protein
MALKMATREHKDRKQEILMLEKELKSLNASVKGFFDEFKDLDWNSLPEGKVQELVNTHNLAVKDIIAHYSVKTRN